MSDGRRVNPFTDTDVSYMLLDLDSLTKDVHPADGTEIPHNHHACIRLREWLAKVAAAPLVDDFDAERYCSAEAPAGPGGPLQCHIKGSPHDGDHWAIGPPICSTCGGVDAHADWCPDLGHAGEWQGSAAYGFDDHDRWWLLPKDAAR